ncbi:MAG: hypothetical protein ACPGO5_00360 [Patescibacteria group bacterium]
MKCPYCGFEEEQSTTTCSRCGNALASSHSDEVLKSEAPKPDEFKEKKQTSFTLDTGAKDAKGNGKIDLEFFDVPTQKFVVLSIVTFGYYYLYWAYKNWKAIKDQRQAKLHPLGRAIFLVLYFIQLGNIVLASAKKRGYTKKYSSVALFLALLVLYIFLGIIDDTESLYLLWPLGFLDVLLFLPIVKAIQFNNQAAGAPKPTNHYNGWEITVIVLGGLFFAIAFLGTILETLNLFGLGWV